MIAGGRMYYLHHCVQLGHGDLLGPLHGDGHLLLVLQPSHLILASIMPTTTKKTTQQLVALKATVHTVSL
jgi:hypothetical protein